MPITVREDAPAELRYAVISIAANSCEMSASSLRSIVCGVLFVPPDRNNWSAENVWMEVERLLEDCPRPKVYDIAEAIWQSLEFRGPNHEYRDVYPGQMNRLFLERGIGWKFTDDQGIVFRGDETFGEVTASAEQVLADDGRASAAEHVRQALKDLSARPADLTGGIHYAAAALEATARDVTGRQALPLAS